MLHQIIAFIFLELIIRWSKGINAPRLLEWWLHLLVQRLWSGIITDAILPNNLISCKALWDEWKNTKGTGELQIYFSLLDNPCKIENQHFKNSQITTQKTEIENVKKVNKWKQFFVLVFFWGCSFTFVNLLSWSTTPSVMCGVGRGVTGITYFKVSDFSDLSLI